MSWLKSRSGGSARNELAQVMAIVGDLNQAAEDVRGAMTRLAAIAEENSRWLRETLRQRLR